MKSRPLRKRRANSSELPWQPTRRQIWLTVTTALLALVIIVGLVVFLSVPHRLTPEDRAMIASYESVRVALSHDDLVSANKFAVALAESAGVTRTIADDARAIANADSLESARDAFSMISRSVVKMVKGNTGYYVAYCPMGSCPAPCGACKMARFGDWVQMTAVVQNPFMGIASPHCGIARPSGENR